MALKLKHRMLIGFSLPLAMALAVAGYVFLASQDVASATYRASDARTAALEAANIETSLLVMLEENQAFMLTGAPANLEKYEAASAWFDAATANLAKLDQSETAQALLASTRAGVADYREIVAQQQNLILDGHGATAILLSGQAARIIQSVQGNVATLLAHEEQVYLGESATAAASSLRLGQVVLASGIGAAIVGIGAALFIAWRLGSTMDKNIDVLSATSASISTVSAQQERVASNQVAAVAEVATTLEELGKTAHHTDEQAQLAARSAQEALEATQRGAGTVQETLNGIHALKDKATIVRDQMSTLAEQTSQIGSVTDVVTEIANQTNMLALNAAVEASRAGESGRGFAVVAKEIRQLADQSKKSAERINALVAGIQKAASGTAKASDESLRTVESFADLAKGTTTAFKEIESSVNKSYESTHEISAASKQQAVALGQVVETMSHINQGARETSASIVGAKQGLLNLEGVTTRLKAIV